jgi:phage shock protein A
MADAAKSNDAEVVEMVDYLRETLREMDEGIAEMTQRRKGIAIRLAVIEASTAPAVQAVESSDPSFDGRDAEAVLSEAHRRFGS